MTISFRLPPTMKQKTIADLKNGEVGYTVPWAMFVNQERLYIIASYPIDSAAFGTSRMKVTKRQGNYYVDCYSIGDHKYQESSGNNYVGVSQDEIHIVAIVDSFDELPPK